MRTGRKRPFCSFISKTHSWLPQNTVQLAWGSPINNKRGGASAAAYTCRHRRAPCAFRCDKPLPHTSCLYPGRFALAATGTQRPDFGFLHIPRRPEETRGRRGRALGQGGRQDPWPHCRSCGEAPLPSCVLDAVEHWVCFFDPLFPKSAFPPWRFSSMNQTAQRVRQIACKEILDFGSSQILVLSYPNQGYLLLFQTVPGNPENHGMTIT